MALINDSKKNSDHVRPGEQWFFYWKTSAALWEARLEEFAPHEMIFIPIYWGFHAESDGTWDFGKYHPERDLFRLIDILTQRGRNFCWLLPLTPAPFLPNGGVPISSARVLSISEQGMHLACLDQNSTLHKMYSYYEPKVFQAFASFVKAFNDMLLEQKVGADVWGVDFLHYADKKTISFLDDYSIAFEQGFSRYLKKNFPEGLDLQKAKDEQHLKSSFRKDVSLLFKSMAQESLPTFWKGIKSITVLGASPKDTIERAIGTGKSETSFFKDLFEMYVSGHWFSTSLLTSNEKKNLLKQCLNEHFNNEEIQHTYQYQTDESELSSEFRPYSLVDIFDCNNPHIFETNGLKSFLNDHLRWMYYLHDSLEFRPDWIDHSHHRIKFFHAEGMDRVLFAQMLKLFMMRQKIVLDISGLSEELDKRLQVFYLENNLKLQSINFLTNINLCELGEGRFLTFEGSKLKSSENKSTFWNHLFKFLNINHPSVKADQEIFSLWRIRATSPHELNYLDVRRVNFYNPTSYKKSVIVHTQKKFAFMKIIDPLHANAITTSEGVEVELLPNGKVALDFGHYEERL